MEKETQKISFFTRVKIAVAKLENYSLFLEEKTSITVKYFFLIVLILAIVMSLVETYSIMKTVKKGYQYMQNEMPDFSYTEEGLQFSKNVNAYDEEFDFFMIADTSDSLSEEKVQAYKEQIKSVGFLLLKDKLIYKVGGNEIEYVYRDFTEEYGITSFDKTQLLERLNQVGTAGMAGTIFLMLLFGLYIIQVISIFIDWLVITLFAFIVARICRIAMTFKQLFHIAIYALTLPIILTMLYNIAYYLTGFYTEYFRMVYLLISYVYVVAVILMIKSDLLKQQVELTKIAEVQKQVHEEQKDTEEKEEEKKNENKKPEEEGNKEDNEIENGEITGEPDGSEI